MKSYQKEVNIMSNLSWLSKLYYEMGKQQTDFRCCSTFLKDGTQKFSKWKHYMALQSNDIEIAKVNQREQLKNEIILDRDKCTDTEYKQLIEQLKKDGIKFYAYSTEDGRARHIHTFWKGIAGMRKIKREFVREEFIKIYNCDTAFKIDAHMIPIEYCEHWKTGKIKNLIDSVEGFNEYKEPFKEEETEEPKEERKEYNNPIKIDHYIDNAKEFYDKQPFFYDDSGIFWLWKEYKWEIVDNTELSRMLDAKLGFYGQTVTSGLRSNHIEAMKWVGRERRPKEPHLRWIQFKDKAFSLRSKKVHTVTRHFFFTNPIPWELGETSDTPMMDKLFTEWVGEKYVPTLYEIIAYCCYRDYPIHLILCFIGCGRNGKSSFLSIARKFLGKDNVCSTELDVLITSRFESFKLYRKMCCLLGETNFNKIDRTSLLKKLVGQDLVSYEAKNKLPFDDMNYAKIIISSNNLPPTEDTSEGFYRRWLIIDFPNNFPEGKDITLTVPEEEYKNLGRKVIDILPELLERGTFTNQGSIEERKCKYTISSNPINHFIAEFCEIEINAFGRFSEVYTAYAQYLEKIKRRNVNRRVFGDVLTQEGYEIQKTSKKIGEEWVNDRWISGLRLKDGVKDKFRAVCDSRANNLYSFSNTWEKSIENEHESHKCPKNDSDNNSNISIEYIENKSKLNDELKIDLEDYLPIIRETHKEGYDATMFDEKYGSRVGKELLSRGDIIEKQGRYYAY